MNTQNLTVNQVAQAASILNIDAVELFKMIAGSDVVAGSTSARKSNNVVEIAPRKEARKEEEKTEKAERKTEKKTEKQGWDLRDEGEKEGLRETLRQIFAEANSEDGLQAGQMVRKIREKTGKEVTGPQLRAILAEMVKGGEANVKGKARATTYFAANG